MNRTLTEERLQHWVIEQLTAQSESYTLPEDQLRKHAKTIERAVGSLNGALGLHDKITNVLCAGFLRGR